MTKLLTLSDVEFLTGSTIGYTLPLGVYELSDNKLMSKSLFPNNVKVTTTIADIRLGSNLTTNKTIRFTKNSFLSVVLGFIQSRSSDLGDIEGFIQLISGTYKSDKPQ